MFITDECLAAFCVCVFPLRNRSLILRRSRSVSTMRSLEGIERFSYDLEMKSCEQNRNNKRREIERFDWFVERIQTRVAFGWLSESSAEKTSCPKNFLEIALTSYCDNWEL